MRNDYLGHEIVAEGITLHEARKLEREKITLLLSRGLSVLNQTKGGETGGRFITFDEIRVSALKHQTRSAWKYSDQGMYAQGRKSGHMDELCAHMHTPRATADSCAKRRNAMLRIWQERKSQLTPEELGKICSGLKLGTLASAKRISGGVSFPSLFDQGNLSTPVPRKDLLGCCSTRQEDQGYPVSGR